MNLIAATILTILQFGGAYILFLLVIALVVWAVKQIIHEYWQCKAACLKVTGEHAPDMEQMFRLYMNTRNGTRPESGKQGATAEK